MYELAAHVFVWDVKHDANHEAAPSNFNNVPVALAKLFKFFHQVIAYEVGILYQSFVFKHVKHSECGGAGKMITAECSSQLAVDRFEFG